MSHSAHIFTNFGFFSAPVKSRAPAPAVPRATWIVRDIFRQHLAPKTPHSVRETRPFRLYKRSPALSRSVCRMKRWGNNDVHSWCPLLPPGRCPPHGDTLPEARWPEKQTRCRATSAAGSGADRARRWPYGDYQPMPCSCWRCRSRYASTHPIETRSLSLPRCLMRVDLTKTVAGVGWDGLPFCAHWPKPNKSATRGNKPR